MLRPRHVDKDFDVAVVVAGDQDVAAVQGGRVGIPLGLGMLHLRKGRRQIASMCPDSFCVLLGSFKS